MASSSTSRGGASPLARGKALSALSIVFAGFVLLVLVSQISWHFLAQAVLAYFPNDTSSIAGTQRASVLLAYSAGAMGLAFSAAILFITRGRLDSELRVYKVTGLPVSSALRLMLSSHPVGPLAWVLVTGIASAAVDLDLGLDAALPLYLTVVFAVLLIGWLVFITVSRFWRRDLGPGMKGRVG